MTDSVSTADADASQNDVLLNEPAGCVERSMSLIDSDLTREYHEALSEAPQRVRQETPVLKFLKAEDLHTLRAAKRTALWWKYRKEFCGKERWLRPMSQVSLPKTETINTSIL